MSYWLKQSTAVTIKFGPFLDSADGNTVETGLTISQADIRLSKNGGNIAQSNNVAGATHDELGFYDVPLDTTDTNTLGSLMVAVHETGALPVFQYFMVVEADAYDALFAAAGTGHIEADAVQISGDATAANNAESFFDGTGYAGTNNVIPTVTTLTGHTAQTGDNYARLGAPAGASVSADVAAVKAETALIVADTNELQTDDIPGTLATIEGKIDTVDTNVDAVLVDTGTTLDAALAVVDANVDAILTDTGTTLPATLTTIESKIDTVDTNVDAVLVDTNELQTDDVPGLIAALNDVSAADVNAQVDAAIETYHLDHLLAADYDPASKPGVATALLNELVENDAGVSRFTANALEEAPTGGSAPTAAEIVDEWETQSQADPTGFHVNVMEVNGTAQTANDNGADINAILTDTGTTLPATLATIDGNVDSILTDTGTTLDTKLNDIQGATFNSATDSLEAIRDRGDAAWTTGAGTGLTALATGTAQGGSASTIQLAAGESFGDNILNGTVVKITSGTGAGQARVITAYTGATDTATIYPNWTTNPDATSVYEIVEGSMNLAAVSLDGAAADNLELDYDGTGYAKANSTIGTTTTNTDMRGTDSAALAATALTNATWTDARAGYLDELGAANIPADVDAILTDTGTTLPATLTTIEGKVDTVDTNVDAVLVDTGTTLDAAIAAVKAETALIVADTNELQTDLTNGGRLDLLIDAILADTGELQTDWANGGRLDLIIDAILADTGELQSDDVPGLIAALNNISAADVNAQVLDVLATDTFAEPGQGAPPATASLAAKLNYLYKAWRNKITQTADTLSIFNDAGAVVDQKATISDDGTDYTRGEIGSGP